MHVPSTPSPNTSTHHLFFSRRLYLAAVYIIAALTSSKLTFAGQASADAERTLSPYFVVEGGDSGIEGFPLLSTAVNVAVSGVIADVRVTQTYKNGGKNPINARYVFPASTRAAVHGLKMKLGDRIVTAKIREREQAKAEFEKAKREGKTASLLEQERPNVFTMGVANILPNDQIEVTLEYTELLVPEGGTYEWVFPTVVGPRYSSSSARGAKNSEQFVESPHLHAGRAPHQTLTLQGSIASGIAVAKAGVETHKVNITWENPKLLRFELDPSEKFSSNKDFILHYRLAGDVVQTGLSLYEKHGEKFFMAMAQAPNRVRPEQIPAREFVFVVDVSGSMAGFPLETTQALLSDLVRHLRPVDTFNLLFFSGDSKLMAPASVPANEENLKAAVRMLGQLEGNGGTELLPALKQALSLPVDAQRARSFVVVTDGFISAEAGVFEYIRNNLGRANVYSFGIGSSVNRFLVEGVAKAGLGIPFIVTEPSQAKAQAEKLREYIEAPLLTHVKVRFEGFDAYAVEPKALPDVLMDRPVVIQGKWRGNAVGAVVLSGTTGSGPYQAKLALADATRGEMNSALPYLWARTRIGSLSDFAAEELPATERQEVVLLGLKYNLLTRYTSFIAVSEQMRNPSGNASNVAQPSALPVGVSDAAVGDDVMGADEPGFLLLLPAALLGLGLLQWQRARGAMVVS